MFTLEFAESAVEDLQVLRKHEQTLVLDAIERLLSVEPLTPTRRRKQLRSSELSSWELRVGKFRVFYDVDGEQMVVFIKAIGWKEHNRLFIRGREFVL